MADPAATRQLLKLPPIDYTSRDFPSIKADLLKAIPYKTPEWTDLNESDLGVVLLDLMAHAADVLHFYLDRNANEAFLMQAITRRSVINLLQLIDYRLRSAVPASVDLTFTIPVLPGNLTIPAGTQCQTSADVTGKVVLFETVEDLVIIAGGTTGTVGASEGETKEEILPLSDGTPAQRVPLTATPIIEGTIELFVDEGIGFELWTEVLNFVGSDELSHTFTSGRDENENVTIFLGDGVQGKIPVAGSDMKARFRVGGGVRGNVGAETIITVVTPITYMGNPVAVEVINPAQASGGEDRQSIEEAKILGPRSLRALNRAVTAEDYETLAEQFPGVAKTKLVVAQPPYTMEDEGCCCQLTLMVAPEGGGPPSSVLKADLLAYFDARKMVGTCLKIGEPDYVKVDVEGTVYVASNFDVEAVALDLATRLESFFDLAGEFVGFGTPIYLSDVVRMMDETPGIDHIDVGKLTRKPTPEKDVWRTGGATVHPTCGASGDEAAEPCEDSIDEVWTITFVSPTQYTLRNGVGVAYGPFTVGALVPCSSTDKRVQVCVSAGATPMCAADRGTFRTSLRFGNVPMGASEIPIKGDVVLTFIGGAKSQRVCP